MEKKKYIKPILESEVFIPQEYVASCYDYDALFYCEKGKKAKMGTEPLVLLQQLR